MTTLADVLRQTGYSQDGTLATPTPTESPMTKALAEHIKSIPQKFNENQAYQMELLSKAFPGNTYESMMTQGDPKAMAELAMQTPFNAMIAYHGTPHKILGGFDISKVGTGEGAQAYGHGMYFAENPKVAEAYKTQVIPAANLNAASGKSFDSIEDFFNEVKPKGVGNLYKVDIPDEHIPNMLDWDKPISQQSDVVKKALGISEDKFANFRIPATGTNYAFSPNMTGSELYKELTNLAKTQAGASELMNSLGIKGIRYLDAGSRPTNIMDTRLESLYQKHGGDIQKAADDFMRTIHESPKKKAEIRAGIIKDLENRPTSNFVVFDPSTVKILEENGKPLTRKELIEEQVNKLKD